MYKPVVMFLAAALAFAACTSGADTAGTNSGSGGSGPTSTAGGAEAGRAPGVTADSVKVGITYVDFKALGNVALDHGDYQKMYTALIDDVNARGGINGRKLVPVFAPENPAQQATAAAACTKLAADEKDFVTLGFILGDDVLCYVETNDSAVIGGDMSPERLQRAKAPWFGFLGTDLQSDAVRTLAKSGKLGGKVGVYAISSDADLMNKTILPLLGDLHVHVVDHAVNDAPPSDRSASISATESIAQKFQSEGIDTVLSVGNSANPWLLGIESTGYRPINAFPTISSALSYANDAAGHDLFVLKGAVAADTYGPKGAQFREATFQKCNAVLEHAGIKITDPATYKPGDPQPFVGALDACTNIELLTAILKAAGPKLDYATFRKAGYSLGDVAIAGSAKPYHYGAPPHADGDAPTYLFTWKPATKSFQLTTS